MSSFLDDFSAWLPYCLSSKISTIIPFHANIPATSTFQPNLIFWSNTTGIHSYLLWWQHTWPCILPPLHSLQPLQHPLSSHQSQAYRFYALCAFNQQLPIEIFTILTLLFSNLYWPLWQNLSPILPQLATTACSHHPWTNLLPSIHTELGSNGYSPGKLKMPDLLKDIVMFLN